MSLAHTKFHLEKIIALYKSMAMNEKNITVIERDLMLQYVRNLYETLLALEVRTAFAPPSVAVPETLKAAVNHEAQETPKTPEPKSEPKPDIKIETKIESPKVAVQPEPKPEVKPEVKVAPPKAEAKPEVKPEIQPDIKVEAPPVTVQAAPKVEEKIEKIEAKKEIWEIPTPPKATITPPPPPKAEAKPIILPPPPPEIRIKPEPPRQESTPIYAPKTPSSVVVSSEIKALFEEKMMMDLSERLSQTPIADLTRAFSINDRLLNIKELFGGQGDIYHTTLGNINEMQTFAQAEQILLQVATQNNWAANEDRQKQAKNFIKVVRRRFK